jgi:hypothetical protein
MTTTEVLHRLTSYEPGRAWDAPVNDPRILQGLKTNDSGRNTPLVKQYPATLPRIPLPREFPPACDSALDVLAGTAHPAATALDLTGLSRLLHLSAGVARTRTVENGLVHPFRASGSAGARFPLELYVAVPEGGILPGVHWYDPVGHALAQVGPAPRAARAVAALIVTGIPWRYRERGYRRIYWDAGTMLSQALALAGSAGLDARLYTEFPDAAGPGPALVTGVRWHRDRAERDGGRACASASGDDAGEQPGHARAAAVAGWRPDAQAVHGAALFRPQDRPPL